MKFNFIQRGDNQVMGRDVKLAMIKAAPEGQVFYDELAKSITDYMASPDMIAPTLFALTRATGMVLKTLDKVGFPVKVKYEAMLDVWLKDVEDSDYLFYALTERLLEYKRTCL